MKLIKKVVIYLLILTLGGFFAFTVAPYLRQFLFSTGLLQEKIMIAGTGSMYPTFPKGEGKTDIVRAQKIVAWPKMRRFPSSVSLFGFNLFSYQLQRGDIVDFENAKTKAISKEKYGEEAGFVKRIIALPGDTIDLRDGFVYINGNNLDEPYTAKPRSTFGAEFLSDCQSLAVAAGKVFVMGDNRKASLDSRHELGLVDLSDIRYVIPTSDQGEYKKSFRDTREDILLAHTASLDAEEFVRLLNEKRKEKNLKALRYDKLLSLSSNRRGAAMIATDDFSTDATRSGVTLAAALQEVGYRNILSAEVSTRGYFEADELLDNFLEFPQTQKILFGSDYQDIGLAPVLGEVNNCPVQVIVVHLGGYVPPNYKAADIDSWQKLLDNLDQAISSWEQIRGAQGISESKLEQLLALLRQRREIANRVYSRMKTNQWLSEEEKKWVEDDRRLAEEAERLIGELKK